MAQNILLDFHSAFQLPSSPVASPHRPSGWFTPPPGQIKFNLDASRSPDGTIGLVGAFRDFARGLISFVADHVACCFDIESVESLACLYDVRKAHEEGFRDLIFELDNQGIVCSLQSGIIPRTPAGTIISDILRLSS